MSRFGALLPREHGAYAELVFPLATGLGLARPRLSTLALALAAVAFFLAHEPLAVLLGARGERLRSKLGNRARARGAFLLAVGIALGVVAIVSSPTTLWPSLLYPTIAALLLLPVVHAGRQKTLPGEVLVVTTFATLIFPLTAASGGSRGDAEWAFLVWWFSFFMGTLEVHAIKARHKNTRRSRWTRWGSPATSGAAAILCVWGAGLASGSLRWAALALLPPSVAVTVLSILRVHPRNLKRVGWTLVGANTLTLAALLLAR